MTHQFQRLLHSGAVDPAALTLADEEAMLSLILARAKRREIRSDPIRSDPIRSDPIRSDPIVS
jgi:hypothetical protein